MGWVAPSMAVADGTIDCGSVVVCAARWSYMVSGDGMEYRKSHGLYHSSHLVMVGWGHCQQHNNYIQNYPHQTILASLFVLTVSVLSVRFSFCVICPVGVML